MSSFRSDKGGSSTDKLYLSVQLNFTTTRMEDRWSKFGIILCIVILNVCKSSAHFHRRISTHSRPVWRSSSGSSGMNPGGMPMGNYLPAPTPKPYVRTRTISSGQTFPRQGNVQTVGGSSRRVFISGSATGASREALMEQMRKMIKEQQDRIRQQGGNGKFTITRHTSQIIQGPPQVVQGPKSVPVAPPPPKQPYKSTKPLTKSKFTKQEQVTLVQYHNDVRQNLNPPPKIMENMQWSDVLAGKAQEYAEKCEWRHSDKSGRRDNLGYRFVGENLYISTSYGVTKSVKSWADEKAFYDYWANTCVPGQQCGHYTQMIWGTTNMVGCGIHFCKKVSFWRRGDAYYVVCNYGPGGNINGARPYEAKTQTSSNNGDNGNSRNSWNSQTSRNTQNSWHRQSHTSQTSGNTQDNWNSQPKTGNSRANIQVQTSHSLTNWGSPTNGNPETSWNSRNSGTSGNSATRWNGANTATGVQHVVSEANHKHTQSKKTSIKQTKTSSKSGRRRGNRRKNRSRRRRRRR